jgi:hypothetical protein
MFCASSTTLTAASVVFALGFAMFLIGVAAIRVSHIPQEKRFSWSDLLGRVRQARKEDNMFKMVEEVNRYGFSELK